MSSLVKSFSFIKSLLIKVLFVIILSAMAITFISNYVNGGDQGKIDQLNQMIEEQTTVTADLSDHYVKETILKSVTKYKFDYFFELNGQRYVGKIYLNGIPDTNKLTIYYLSSDPNIVSADPFNDIKTEKEHGSNSDLIFGVILALIAVILIFSIFLMFKQTDKTKQEEVVVSKAQIKTVEEKTIAQTTAETSGELKTDKIDKEDYSRFMPH